MKSDRWLSKRRWCNSSYAFWDQLEGYLSSIARACRIAASADRLIGHLVELDLIYERLHSCTGDEPTGGRDFKVKKENNKFCLCPKTFQSSTWWTEQNWFGGLLFGGTMKRFSRWACTTSFEKTRWWPIRGAHLQMSHTKVLSDTWWTRVTGFKPPNHLRNNVSILTVGENGTS